jgi:large subunit ribosomal protein L25
MARKELKVAPRQVLGKKVAQLRRQGMLPANIYGHGLQSVSVQVDGTELYKALKAASVNEVIDIKIEGERSARPAIIHHIQRHPLTSGILHADFYQVSLREKMRADVPIVLTGTSPAVSDLAGILLQGNDVLHVEALPLDIPVHIEVDVSALTELESSLHVRDLKLPANVTVLTEPDVMVARVAAPRVTAEDEVQAKEEAAAAATEPEPAP